MLHPCVMKRLFAFFLFLNLGLSNAQNIYLTAGVAGPPGFSGDGGLAVSATLYQPHGVEIDSLGNVYIADSGNSSFFNVIFAPR